MITLKIDNLTVQAIGASTDRICYVLFPLDGPQGWMEALAQRVDVSVRYFPQHYQFVRLILV